MGNRDTGTELSRRRLIRTTGAGLAGLAATPALASAQDENESTNGSGNGSGNGTDDDSSRRIQTRGIIPETNRVTKENDYTGFLVQLTARLEVNVASGELSCSFANWSPENTTVYETQIIDRIGQERDSIASSLYVPSDVDLRPGDLLIINSQHDCSGAYIGVRLENIYAPNRERGYVAADSNENGTEGGGGETGGGGSSGAFGPGFGPLAAVGGLVGGAYALARRGDGGE